MNVLQQMNAEMAAVVARVSLSDITGLFSGDELRLNRVTPLSVRNGGASRPLPAAFGLTPPQGAVPTAANAP